VNKPSFAVALVGLVLSSPCFAADCLLPTSILATPRLSLVAPEMLRPVLPDPFCASAQEALARIRAPAAAMAAAAGAYVPLTKDDNSPWRFDMSQNGKRMTAAEFDAWMKAKGIRVATGKPAEASTPDTPPPATSTPQTDQ